MAGEEEEEEEEGEGRTTRRKRVGMSGTRRTTRARKASEAIGPAAGVLADATNRGAAPAPAAADAVALPVLNAEALLERLLELVAELELEVDVRSASLLQRAQNSVSRLRSEFKVQMLKISKKVRTMPLREFRAKFGGTMDEVLLEQMSERAAGGAEAGAAAKDAGAAGGSAGAPSGRPRRKRGAPHDDEAPGGTTVGDGARMAQGSAPPGVAEGMYTPGPGVAGTSRTGALPMETPAGFNNAATVLRPRRRARIGEEIISVNGSPLGAIDEGEEGPEGMRTPHGGVSAVPAIGIRTAIRMGRTGRVPRQGGLTRVQEDESGEEEDGSMPMPELDLQLTTADGKLLDLALDTANIQSSVSRDQRHIAVHQLQALQEQVLAYMNKLRSPEA